MISNITKEETLLKVGVLGCGASVRQHIWNPAQRPATLSLRHL